MKKMALVSLMLCQIAVFAQKNEMSVLNNRFYCVFPDSAKNTARGTDIMAPGPNENSETRIVYDEGDKRLVFFAKELHVKTVANLAKKLSKESSKENPVTVKTVYDKDGVLALLITPQRFDYEKKAILISSLVIQNADGMLSRIDAYINQRAFDNRNRFQPMIDQAFSSFREGEKRVSLAARTETFAVIGSTAKLQIKLPQDYILIKDNAVDFEVYRIEKVPEYGDKEASFITIYLGHYPTMLSGEYQLAGLRKPDTEQDFLYNKRLWQNYNDPVRSLILREQLFDVDQIAKGMKVHIAILTNSPKRMEEMSDIVKELEIVNGQAGGK